MNDAVIPAAVAAGGGTALLSAIVLHERRRERAMRASRNATAVRFPMNVEVSAAEAGLGALAGLSSTNELVAETVADWDGITHLLRLPSAIRSSAAAVLTSAMPGLRLSEPRALNGRATLAVRLFVPTPSVLRGDGVAEASRALLAGLAGLGENETVVMRWALRPGPPRPSRENTATPVMRELERAWRRKTAGPGFGAAGLVMVRADRVSRARELADHVTGVLRSRKGDGPGVRTTWERAGRTLASLPRTSRSSGWLSVQETLPLLAWPLGSASVPGVELGAARELVVPRHVSSDGRRLFVGRDGRGLRPVALSLEAARHHVGILGPSGSGKSVMLARGVLDDLESGAGGAVIDPKHDLATAIADRVPVRQADRVIFLDPAADGPIPGVALLGTGDPELRSDVLVGVMRSLFPEWGIRSDLYARMGLRTLSEIPGATLADLGRLFFEKPYRDAAVARLSDPLLIGAWRAFDALSPAEQAQHVEAPMARLMALIGRPSVRAVLASRQPKLDMSEMFREGKWVLISLAPGQLGEPAARLVGSALLHVIWSAIEARTALPPEARRPVFIYVDELASLSALPFGFELLAERARGLGAGLVVASQTLGRLPETTRTALLGNVGSLVTFRAGADEAARMSRELPGLTAADLQSLGPFEVAARVGTGIGSAVAVMTGHTEPLPPVTGQLQRIRRQSAERYGSDPEEAARPNPEPSSQMSSLGRTGRPS